MRIIGLAGGVGSGKSTITLLLKELGATTVDLDKVGHEVLKHVDVKNQLVKHFGDKILSTDGDINRRTLGDIVYNDKEALATLNSIVHPVIDAEINEKVREYQQQGVEVLVLEAAVMLESGRQFQVDEIWVTTASEETVLERLKDSRAFSEETVRARIKSQMSNEERAKLADVVIDNEGTLDELRQKVNLEWEKLRGRIGNGEN